MKIRLIALCCVLALLAAACGSRVKDDLGAADGAGSSSGGGSGATPTTAGGDGGGDATDANGFGTLANPCGPAESGTPAEPTAKDDGVSKDAIKIAVISDRAGTVKVPTISIEESMVAFTEWCNGFGGVNGRKLELTKIDSKLFSQLEATREACDDKVFAIVGSGSVTDNQGAQAMVDCKLIEVPAYTVTPDKGLSDRLVAPLPNPTYSYNSGPARYMKKQFPDAIKKAAIVHGNIEAVNIQAARVKEAYEKMGYTFIYDKQTDVIQESYASEAKAMKDAGVEYFTMISATSETAKMLRDMKTQGFEPKVIDLGQQFYDTDLLAEPGAEGAHVLLNTVPFEEASDSPALQAFLDAYEGSSAPNKPDPTSLGVQSFSAGLLFATALKAAGDDLTRDNVLAELKKIKEWDGGGLHYTTDPGDNAGSDCFMYDRVEGGKFVREFPTEAATFECDPDYPIELTGDYGKGASAAG